MTVLYSSSKIIHSQGGCYFEMCCQPLRNICITNDQGYVPICRNRVSQSSPFLIHNLFPEHLSSFPFLLMIALLNLIFTQQYFVDCCLSFALYFLAIVLSVLLQITASDTPLVSSSFTCTGIYLLSNKLLNLRAY